MIQKSDEFGKEEKKVVSFKKFSDLSKKKPSEEEETEASMPARPFVDTDMPQGPNVHKEKGKKEKFMDTSHMKPKVNNPSSDEESKLESKDVTFFGKVAKLPKGVKASKGYNFLENIKVSKSSIWYLLVEKQDNELQMVKYNHKKGVDLSKFVNDLKSYYITKNKSNQKICKMIEAIGVDGNDKYSWIKNIPLIDVDGKKMVTKITEDLIKLLSK
jgi:hypothetical protein